jgi:hypothetical protein
VPSKRNPESAASKRAVAWYEEYYAAPYPTYAEMGIKYGVSRQRVQQVVKRGEIIVLDKR